MRTKMTFHMTVRFTDRDIQWLRSQAEELGVDVTDIVRLAVRQMRLNGGAIQISPFVEERKKRTTKKEEGR